MAMLLSLRMTSRLVCLLAPALFSPSNASPPVIEPSPITAITFSLSTSSGAPIEYWEPSDGSYSDDIRAKFPSAAADEALQNDQAYIEDLKTVCYQKALEVKNGAAS